MRALTFLSLLATFFAGAAQAATPAAPPQFGTLFVGFLDVDLPNVETINNSTFGTRVYAPITGGNLTDPTSGKLAATVLPGSADTGVISNSGAFFPVVSLPLRWEVDQKLAYLHVTGIGKYFTSDLLYVHLETASETYSALNSRFLVANLTFVEGDESHPVLTVFGTV
ncbi:hypothetical protein L227DRAFT_597222 [Lentinus tigrinus ALCF2SS1-6]|uniref:Uncharacterized protein n=1 Tax=Lentinus tigrinus ALCF2SS1-6 TaxID=1328759 RepID=A0A5C2SRK7_9APHY|nr:hypothetical protein L227DRAFT_597222 [Lentinus tigrinus ALCF2SS1-6]